jgi:hypothetical protein
MTSRLQSLKYLTSLEDRYIEAIEDIVSLPNGNRAGRTADATSKILAVLSWWESPCCGRKVEELVAIAFYLDHLCRLPDPQLSQIVFVLSVPHGELPGQSAAQIKRVVGLLKWLVSVNRADKLRSLI